MRIGPPKRVIEVDPVEEPVPGFVPSPEEPLDPDPDSPPEPSAPVREPAPDAPEKEPAGLSPANPRRVPGP
jgi:hypothetical protein